MPFLAAQLSDLHVRRRGRLCSGRVDTCAALERAIEAVMRVEPRPDVVLLTGDLVDAGDDDAEYAELRDILSTLGTPWYLIPGNHDGRAALRRAFPDRPELHREAEFIQYALDDYPIRLLFLDTLDPGSGEGLLDGARLAWLEAELRRAPERDTAIVMHHPPFKTGIRFMDGIACRGTDEFARIVRAHGRVHRIMCGHLHRAVTATFAGTAACSAPSTAHQIRLDLRPHDSSPGEYTLEPPGFLLHYWSAECGFATHLANIDQFPGPFPFDD